MGYAPHAIAANSLELELLAVILQRGAPAAAELVGGPNPGKFLTGPGGLALQAACELSSRGELLSPEAVETALRAAGANGAAADARNTMDLALEAYGGRSEPGQAGRILHALADAGVKDTPEAESLLGVPEIFAPLAPVNYLCPSFDMAPGAPTLVAGYGFSGKTLALQDLALAVATGTLAWGRFPVRLGRVLHIDFEQGAYLTRLRYQRLARARGIDPADLGDRLALAPFPGWYLDGDTHDEYRRISEGFDLVLVDSFRAACPRTDENASEARIPLDRLTRASEETGGTSVVIHHARKPSQNAQGGARMSIRGSGALYDASGSALIFSGEKGEPPTIAHEKARITGRLHPDFRLWIEDVEVDGDPCGGLRVAHLDAGDPKANQGATGRFDELKGRVLALVQEEGSIAGGVNTVQVRLGARREDVRAAVAHLIQLGALKRGGSYHEPTLFVPGTDHDSE